MKNTKTVVYTIGHSNHSWERFIELMTPHKIELLVDVRSYPYSRFAPWSNREKLDAGLRQQGINYLWMGDGLGGMPRGPQKRTSDEAESNNDWYRTRLSDPDFQVAIAQVSNLALGNRLALMCSEGDPANCHRTMLLAPAFSSNDFEILHILPKSVGAAVQMPLD